MTDETRPARGRPPATETRERIVLAALEEFSRGGFEATSVQTVANRVEMSKQALMHHFPTKASLRTAVYEHLAAAWTSMLEDVRPALRSLDAVAYTELIEQMASLFEARADVMRFLVRELLDQPDETTAWLLEHARPWMEVLSELEKNEAIRRPGGPPEDAEAIATVAATLLMSLSALASPGTQGAEDLQHFRERVTKAARLVLIRGVDLDRLPR